jgi:flagellar export protein FliJ
MSKAFKFRFEQMLDVRRLKEDIAKRDLALAQQGVREQNRAIVRLLAEEREGKEALRGLKRDVLDIARLRLQEGYLYALERRIRAAAERLQDLGQVEEQKRRDLTEARKEVRVLESHRERQLKAWQNGQDLAERKFLDEVAQNIAGMESSTTPG